MPEYFPKIFGITEDQPLDKEATRAAFQELTTVVYIHLVSSCQKCLSIETKKSISQTVLT